MFGGSSPAAESNSASGPIESFLQIFGDVFGRDVPTPIEVLGAMALSLGLNLLIGTVYKSTYRGTRYSQDYVQTLVLIGTITTILIIVVSGNVGIAFGMFAAFSMLRFRRSLGQARDLAFVLFAMATGMVVGARFYTMALVATVVICAAIAVLTKMDAFAPKRASHRLRLRVTNDIDYSQVLPPIFKEFTDAVELLEVESVQAGMMTELRYGVQMKVGANLRDFIERLQLANGNNRVQLTSNQRDFSS
jgi:uncharacterized membrane protein YhiD involved in acid resistance